MADSKRVRISKREGALVSLGCSQHCSSEPRDLVVDQLSNTSLCAGRQYVAP